MQLNQNIAILFNQWLNFLKQNGKCLNEENEKEFEIGIKNANREMLRKCIKPLKE